MNNNTKMITWLGILLLVVTSLVHFIDAPDSFDEATYKGILFLLNGVGALIAAYGIFRGSRSWGWTLGLLVAAGAFIGYAMSRTVGLPQLPAEPDEWFEPLGILSFLAEGLFVAVYIWIISMKPVPSKPMLKA
ncbi:MAG: hypothetical protein U0175_06505 [Caldilineaceae bacterium]